MKGHDPKYHSCMLTFADHQKRRYPKTWFFAINTDITMSATHNTKRSPTPTPEDSQKKQKTEDESATQDDVPEYLLPNEDIEKNLDEYYQWVYNKGSNHANIKRGGCEYKWMWVQVKDKTSNQRRYTRNLYVVKDGEIVNPSSGVKTQPSEVTVITFPPMPLKWCTNTAQSVTDPCKGPYFQLKPNALKFSASIDYKAIYADPEKYASAIEFIKEVYPGSGNNLVESMVMNWDKCATHFVDGEHASITAAADAEATRLLSVAIDSARDDNGAIVDQYVVNIDRKVPTTDEEIERAEKYKTYDEYESHEQRFITKFGLMGDDAVDQQQKYDQLVAVLELFPNSSDQQKYMLALIAGPDEHAAFVAAMIKKLRNSKKKLSDAHVKKVETRCDELASVAYSEWAHEFVSMVRKSLFDAFLYKTLYHHYAQHNDEKIGRVNFNKISAALFKPRGNQAAGQDVMPLAYKSQLEAFDEPVPQDTRAQYPAYMQNGKLIDSLLVAFHDKTSTYLDVKFNGIYVGAGGNRIPIQRWKDLKSPTVLLTVSFQALKNMGEYNNRDKTCIRQGMSLVRVTLLSNGSTVDGAEDYTAKHNEYMIRMRERELVSDVADDADGE